MCPDPCFGRTLQRLRKQVDMSILRLAVESGVAKSTIWKINSGAISGPSIMTIDSLARALGMKASELVAEWERDQEATSIQKVA